MGLAALVVRCCALACALALAPAARAAIALTDDLGRRVELQAPAQRLVTLAPFLTELAFSAGAGASVVGVSAHSDFPAEARNLPQVTSAASFSIEAALALRPDLVLAWRDTLRPEDLRRLERFGVPVFAASARSLEDVPRLLEAIGRLTARDVAPAAGSYRGRIAALRRAHAGVPRVGAFLEIWHQPLTTIAGRHWINESLEACGAQNVFRDLPGVAPVVPWESVYQRDPALVVGTGPASGEREFRAQWQRRSTLAAVRRDALVFVDGDLLLRPTLRLADGVTRLCAEVDRARRGR